MRTERPRGYNLTNFSPKTEATHSFVGAEAVYDENGIVISYNVAMLSPEQVTNYIVSCDNYMDKACVSLNSIFVPYATYGQIYRYDSNGNPMVVFASGNYSAISGHPMPSSGISVTTYDIVANDAMFPGNIYSTSGAAGYPAPIRDSMRSVGLNKDVYFVGTNPSGFPVAGPLEMSWDTDHWSAGGDVELKIGTLQSIDSAFYTSSGIWAGYGIMYLLEDNSILDITNLDPNLSLNSHGYGRLCICAKVTNDKLKSKILNMGYDKMYVPIYIGC